MNAEQDQAFRGGYPILSVGDAVETLNDLLGDVFPYAWIRGEISGLKLSYAGHAYFALKDDAAQLSCACFRGALRDLPFELEEGMQVLCGGRLEVYAERGSLQLIVQQAEPQGVGALALAFAQLKEKLTAEGLFDGSHKRELPTLPTTVGVVTSPTGSVIRDILTVSERRHPGIDVVLAPSRVQGDGAAEELCAALQRLQVLAPDVIIIGRGGGSLEDLWAFNTEPVARAIHACTVPIVSAVGHETDTTIADLVADVRAATPSAAAELCVPERAVLRAAVEQHLANLAGTAAAALDRHRSRLEVAAAQIRHPQWHLEQLQQRLDHRVERITQRVQHRLDRQQQRLDGALAQLALVNPATVLQRGYAIASSEGKPIRSIAGLSEGQRLALQFADGQAETTVTRIDPE